MGSGVSSTSEIKRNIRNRETLRISMSKLVEKFIINVYATCPRLEAMHLILECKRGYAAFKTFLIHEKASELVCLHQDIISLLGKPEQTLNELHDGYTKLMKRYVEEGSEQQVVMRAIIREGSLELISINLDDPKSAQILIKSLEQLEDEIIKIMARDQFFRFIQSRHYKKWRAIESSHAMAVTVEDAIGIDIREKTPEEIKSLEDEKKRSLTEQVKPDFHRGSVRNSIRQRNSFRQSYRNGGGLGSPTIRGGNGESNSFSIRQRPGAMDESVSSRNFAVSAFENIDFEAVTTILTAKSWLSCLLPAVEALPLCFSLSMARKGNKSFPYIFVNHYFEKVTGFKSADVLGKNASILLCPLSERDQIQVLNSGMKDGVKTSAIITTRTKDDDQFKNLLVTRPIYSESKVLKYVVILYMDVSRELDDYSSKTSLLCDLADMIPDTILSDDFDDDDDVEKEKFDVFTSCYPTQPSSSDKSFS